MVKAWASREIFFQGDKVGEPITPLETQLRINLMMHDRCQLSECIFIYMKFNSMQCKIKLPFLKKRISYFY